MAYYNAIYSRDDIVGYNNKNDDDNQNRNCQPNGTFLHSVGLSR